MSQSGTPSKMYLEYETLSIANLQCTLYFKKNKIQCILRKIQCWLQPKSHNKRLEEHTQQGHIVTHLPASIGVLNNSIYFTSMHLQQCDSNFMNNKQGRGNLNDYDPQQASLHISRPIFDLLHPC